MIRDLKGSFITLNRFNSFSLRFLAKWICSILYHAMAFASTFISNFSSLPLVSRKTFMIRGLSSEAILKDKSTGHRFYATTVTYMQIL